MSVKKHVVRLKDVKKDFVVDKDPVKILKGVNLHIYPEEFTIVYGSSGSGKSTLINTVLGLEPPSSGRVYVLGKDISHLSEDDRGTFRNETFGVVYQAPHWVKTLTVLENVALPLLISGRDANYANSRGMEQFADRKPVQLSGGQQQKVSVARALVTDPSLIVADEPTGNLDTKSGDELIELFNNLIKNYSRTVVMVTHELRFLKFADRAFKIESGNIVGNYDEKELEAITEELKTVNI